MYGEKGGIEPHQSKLSLLNPIAHGGGGGDFYPTPP